LTHHCYYYHSSNSFREATAVHQKDASIVRLYTEIRLEPHDQSAISLTRHCPQCREIAASVVLNRKDPPHCSHCDCALTVKHAKSLTAIIRATRPEIFQRLYTWGIIRHG